MTSRIVTLWVGSALGRMERMCLASFVAHGHPVALYAFGEIGNLPPGVELRDAGAVADRSELARIAGSPPALTLFADYFRLLLMRKSAGLWVDTDVVCLRPFELDGGFVAGWESADYINNAVLRLAPDSPVLADALAAFESGRAPPWVPFHRAPAARVRTLLGRRVAPRDLPRGTFGPKGMTALAVRHGLAAAARPTEVFYPLHPRAAERLYDPTLRLDDIVTADTLTLHLWNEKLHHLKATEPPRGSILAELFARYPD
ncbi:MAG: hypothetical protein IPK28_19440 [Devosia sp.]|nr:hypothetical protein [Devosia sp.]